MTSSIAWITLLAYEPRVRHVADVRRRKEAAGRLASVRSRVLAELRCAIASGIEGFLRKDEYPDAGLTCHNGRSAEGFVVSRTDDRLGARSLAVDLEADALMCRYSRLEGRISVVREVLTIEIAAGCVALSCWDQGVDRSFATVEALGAFLLAPMLTAQK